MKYQIKNEYINIDNYSPFSHINEVSNEYRKEKFKLPIVNINNNIIPIHPDTFKDLKLDNNSILFYIDVYPTASFRTVYNKDKNIFIKLPLLREITRGIRNLPQKELDRSKSANNLLKELNIKHFNYLEEIPIYNENENYNYIIRKIPNQNITPLFTIIRKKSISQKRMYILIKRLINIWLEIATHGIFLEFHTQNILIDKDLNIYYRDLSDVRSYKYNLLPSHPTNEIDLMTLSFDKTFCEQNLEHIFRYYNELNKAMIIKYIKKRIKYYKLTFRDYSLTFPKNSKERIPIKIEKTIYR